MLNRQIRFRKQNVTFSIHIFPEFEDEALMFIEALQYVRKSISQILMLFKLLKVIKILVIDKPHFDFEDKNILGVFKHPYWKHDFDIVLYGENLREQQYLNPISEYFPCAVYILFHELAHFITYNEDEAKRITRKLMGISIMDWA